ncbi:MAG: DUF2090 domain-containing protein, partial [Pseudomonadota bacterium]
ACGAFAVSRHGCAPAYPSWEELTVFLRDGSPERALRNDAALEHIHHATNRRREHAEIRAFAFDHRAQLESLTTDATRIGRFKTLCLVAAQRVAEAKGGAEGHGILCDGRLGTEALHAAAGTGLWIGRPVEAPGAHPLRLEIGRDYGSALREWPDEHVVKVLCAIHPDDDHALWHAQTETLLRLQDAVRANDLDWLIEPIPSRNGPVDDDTVARLIDRLYDEGLRPDWWKLEPLETDAAWDKACTRIAARDPYCRGILVLGLGAEEAALADSLARAARHSLVKGFAIGRTIFDTAARAWLAGDMDDEAAIADMAVRYGRLCDIWDGARRAGAST